MPNCTVHGRILRRIVADEVIFPEDESEGDLLWLVGSDEDLAALPDK